MLGRLAAFALVPACQTAGPAPSAPTPGPPTPTRRASPGPAPLPVGSPIAERPPDRPLPTADQSGGTLTWALAGLPESLDPANTITTWAEAAGRPLHDGLLGLGPDFQLQPALAERWSVSSDGLRYTFYLRPNVLFHDGTPFDAAAARYNLERLFGEERPRRRDLLLGLVRSVRAADDATLELTLERPFAPLLHQLAQYGAAMVSPTAHQAWRERYGQHPSGTGPFRLSRWSSGGELVLERWDESWRGPPLLDQILIKPVPDAGARLQQLESGEVQLAGPLPFDLLPRLQAGARARLDSRPTARVLGLAINTQAAGLNDRRVRQALNLAIDREALVRTVYQGLATALDGPVGPSVEDARPPLGGAYDPERARQLLAAAGFANGFETVVVGPRSRFPRDVALVQEVQRQLLEVGVKARVETLDQAQYAQTLTRPLDETGLKLALVSWLPAGGEARGALVPLFHSGQQMPRGFNASFFKSPAFDDLTERATRTTDADERGRLWRQAQELLVDEAPWVFLLAPHLTVGRAAGLGQPLLTAWEVVGVTEQTALEPGA